MGVGTSADSVIRTSSEVKAEKKIEHRFKRSDFGWPDTKPLHYDLDFDLTEKRARVISRQTYVHTIAADLTTFVLDAHNLNVSSVGVYKEFAPLPVDGKFALEDKRDFVAHVASFKESSLVPLKFVVDNDKRKVTITLDVAIKRGQQFVLRTDSICEPDEKTLEGIYYDFTPAGQPRTMITQCQQYGFQRIVPCIDSMACKPFYTTSIVADARYTNIITNGDLAPAYLDAQGAVKPQPATPVPEGQPSAGSPRVKVVYYNHLVCMAPYLFFLGVGTYSTYRRRLEYPDGLEIFIELLTFPDAPADACHSAVNSLHDSVIWNNVSTGPETEEHLAEEKKIYALVHEREVIKARSGGLITIGDATPPIVHKFNDADSKRIAEIRGELKSLIGQWKKQGYKYTGRVYREIAMQNSDYGGMENVGNTTIISSRLIPSEDQPDRGYAYYEGVKIHEYYHNINGSQVTGLSPFEIWLNEAVTVHIQRKREDELFGHDYNRLSSILANFRPGGTLAQDASPVAMAVEPEGFESTHELISFMTYQKAPEFVRMIETILGRKAFARGLDLYHTKFAYSNASTTDWVQSMEEASSSDPSKRVNFTKMADGWLKRTGFPEVAFSTAYDATTKKFTVNLKQSGFHGKTPAGPWDFPIEWSLIKVDTVGGKSKPRVLATGVHRFFVEEETQVISGVTEQPDYVSFAQDWSFYGKYTHTNVELKQLELQALTDPDTINRYFAYRAVADRQKAEIVKSLVAGRRDFDVAQLRKLAELQVAILFDDAVTPSTRAMLVVEGDGLNGYPELSHQYQEIYDAKVAIQQAVFDLAGPRLIAKFRELEAANQAAPKDAPHLLHFHERALKHQLLSVIIDGFKPAVLTTRAANEIKDFTVATEALALTRSRWMTDKLIGTARYLETETDEKVRAEAQARLLNEWAVRPDKLEAFISIIANLDGPKAPDSIRALLADPRFKIELAGHARTVARGWAANRKRSVLTPDGLQLTVDLLVRIGRVNQMSGADLLSPYNDLAKFTVEKRRPLLASLLKMRAQLDAKTEETLFKQVSRLLLPYEEGAQSAELAAAKALL